MFSSSASLRYLIIVAALAVCAAVPATSTRAELAAIGSPGHEAADPQNVLSTGQPNILFILIDDLGWKDAGYLGSDFYETPNIDRLAGEGMMFTDAYTNGPNCAPTRASLMSGQYPPRHGIYTVDSSERGDPHQRKLIPTANKTEMDADIITVAEALREGGYATGYVGKWHLGDNELLPTGQGFEFSAGASKSGSPPAYFYPYARGTRTISDLVEGGSEGEYLTDRLTDEALGFIESNQDQPFFLFLSHYAVHTPLQAKEDLVEKYREKAAAMGNRRRSRAKGGRYHAVYAAMIESVDDSVGRLTAKLDELDLTRDTVVVFYSDNGGLGGPTSLVPLRGSKGMLYEGGIRVPLIVRWPGRVAPGSSTAEPVIGVDIYPTLLCMAGVEQPQGQALDGLNLTPVLANAGELGPRDLFWHFPAYLEATRDVEGPWRTAPVGAIRRGDYKLIESFEDGSLELYNLNDDIGERQNLATQMPEKVEDLHQSLIRWRESVNAPVPSTPNPAYESAASTVQTVPYTTGNWDAGTLGNHRAIVRVEADHEEIQSSGATNRAPSAAPDAVRVRIPWRRRDLEPEKKNIVVVDATTGARVENLARVDINREFGEIVFQPATVPGDYYVYYMPWVSEGRSNYPTVNYTGPEETAQAEWLSRHGLSGDGSGMDEEAGEGRRRSAGEASRPLPEAETIEIQSIDELNSFFPMEVIATAAELEALAAAHPNRRFLLFPEDRRYPIRMTNDVPLRWIGAGPGGTFRGTAARGEFYAFQVGVYAMRDDLNRLAVEHSPLISEDGHLQIPAAAFSSFNLEGVNPAGKEFTKEVGVEEGEVQALWFGVQIAEDTEPGLYQGSVTVTPEGLAPETVSLEIEVSADLIAAAGDDEPWRHSRLRWLDSKIAFDDEIVKPFTPVEVEGDSVSILGRQVQVGVTGFPRRISSYFAPEMTHLVDDARGVLHGPIELLVESEGGTVLEWESSGLSFEQHGPGRVSWAASSLADGLAMGVEAEMEFDGNIELTVALTAARPTPVQDVRLRLPLAREMAKYMMGMGLRGGLRPEEHHWKWDVATKNQDGAWIGDVNAGLQFSLRDENYDRPLNTNFYLSKPLVEPSSWVNGGLGGCDLVETDVNPEGVGAEHVTARIPAFLVTCTSGPRTLQPDEPLYFNVRLAVTPFRPIDTAKQWSTRFYHRFSPVDEIAAMGANTINVHHATDINPYINYPFLRPDEMKAYVDEAHARDMNMKIYYTVRELTNRAPELFALRSLGEEIFSTGPGGGWSWLQEHLGSDYIAAWFVPRLEDAAIINSGVSRWHNYYLEGLNWLVNNIEIDGLYIDDVAFDRTTMKRLRKILDRARPNGLIDLHSANQYNERDGFTNSANLYLEHFPYIDRLWFGEYFDYDSQPDFWLVETSGIPFGLMGEMLQDGGNPWRGMLFGMTNRQPYGGHDPSPLWEVWDTFGIQDSRMVGYWVPDPPVTTGHADVLATSYVANGKTMVSIASWAEEALDVRLEIDWEALGIDPNGARITAPPISDFQPAASFAPDDAIRVEPGRGWLLIIEPGA